MDWEAADWATANGESWFTAIDSLCASTCAIFFETVVVLKKLNENLPRASRLGSSSAVSASSQSLFIGKPFVKEGVYAMYARQKLGPAADGPTAAVGCAPFPVGATRPWGTRRQAPTPLSGDSGQFVQRAWTVAEGDGQGKPSISDNRPEAPACSIPCP